MGLFFMDLFFMRFFKKFIPFSAFLRLIRWNNLMIILFTQQMIHFFLLENNFNISFEKKIFETQMLIINISTIFVAIAGYIINDYYDVKIDMINRPDTVIIGKELHRRWAIFLNVFFNFFGLLFAFLLDFKVGIITLCCAVLLWWYSNYLKRKPLLGNVAIALLTAMTVLLVMIFYKNYNEKIVVFAIFAFFITLVREIIKDMEDVKGDNVFGCKTLPILWGIRRSKNVVYVFLTTFLIVLGATFFTFKSIFVLYVLLIIVPLMLFFTYRLRIADRKKDFYFLSQFCKIVMILGVISMGIVN